MRLNSKLAAMLVATALAGCAMPENGGGDSATTAKQPGEPVEPAAQKADTPAPVAPVPDAKAQRLDYEIVDAFILAGSATPLELISAPKSLAAIQ